MPTRSQAQAVPPDTVVENRGSEFAADIADVLREQARVATAMWDPPVQFAGQDQLARAIETIHAKTEALAEAQATAQTGLEQGLGG